jgi:hypothetical protein
MNYADMTPHEKLRARPWHWFKGTDEEKAVTIFEKRHGMAPEHVFKDGPNLYVGPVPTRLNPEPVQEEEQPDPEPEPEPTPEPEPEPLAFEPEEDGMIVVELPRGGELQQMSLFP